MRILYLLHQFPNINSEAFVLNEMIELENMGHDVWILADMVHYVPDSELHDLIIKHDFMSKLIVGDRYLRGRDKLWDFIKKASRDLIKDPVSTKRNLYFVFFNNPYFRDKNVWTKLENYLALRRVPLLRFDLVHVPFAHIDKVDKGIAIANIIRTPLSATFRALELYGQRYRADIQHRKKIFDRINSVITISRFNQQHLEELGFKDVSLIHSAIDPDRFAPDPVKAEDGVMRLITVARFVEKKGIAYLLEALAALKKAGFAFRHTLIGKGPLMEEYERLIAELGLSAEVRLLPPMKQELIKEELAHADIMIAPCVVAKNGDRDILPNVLKEAMAMEIPVITTDISGIEELIDDGQNGILIPDKDAAAIATAVKRLAADPVLRRELGRAGRLKIIENFNIKKEARKLAQVFGATVKKSNEAPLDFKHRPLTMFDEIKYRCDGMLAPETYAAVYDCACQAPAGDILELGAAHGAATVCLARGTVDSGKNSIVYTVEKGQGLGSSMEKFGSKRFNISLLESNLNYFGCRQRVVIVAENITQAAKLIRPTQKFSLLMIDADGAIDRDFRLFYNDCLPGAHIIIDDYENIKDGEHSSASNPFGKSYTTYLLVNYFLKICLLKKEKNIGKTIFCRKPEHITGPVEFDEAELARIRSGLA